MKSLRGAGTETRVDRVRVRPWTDPRLVLGVLLVLGATVLGARVAAASDDRVEYWSVRDGVRAGQPLDRQDLVATKARADGASADQLLAVDAELPAPVAELEWAGAVTGGALVRRDDLVARGRSDARELPVTVADGAAPPDLVGGDRVEVWVGPGPGDESDGPAERVLPTARILKAAAGSGALDGGGSRTVLLRVPATELTGDVVSTIASGHVTLVRLP